MNGDFLGGCSACPASFLRRNLTAVAGFSAPKVRALPMISVLSDALFSTATLGSPASDRLVRAGLKQSIEVGPRHLYHQLPRHLIRKGLVSPSTQVKRARMRETISQK